MISPLPEHRPEIVVYGRQGCTLCRAAEALVARVVGDDGDVLHIDVDTDPDLHRRYTVRVPVVTIDGVEVAELQVDAEQLAGAFARAR